MLALVASAFTSQQQSPSKKNTGCNNVRQRLAEKREAAWSWEEKLYLKHDHTNFPESFRKCDAYLHYSARLWVRRADHYYRQYIKLNNHPVWAIRWIFGSDAPKAISVSSCETGGTFDVWAKNGQFLGMFQMGNYARKTYGHGHTPLEQAYYAYQYFKDAGWRPWSCA